MRFTAPADQDFLLTLFIESRPWLGWAEGQPDFIRNLYEMQYTAMRKGQEAVYPEHLDFIIEKTGQKLGRLIVDLGHSHWRVSELQILTEARGKGIGSDVLRSLQAAANGMLMPITLCTPMMGSYGRQVYERLGFRVMAVEPPHYHMAWLPQGHPLLATAPAA